MTQDDIKQRYFEWLYHLVCGSSKYSRLSYRNILAFLHSIEFTWVMRMDKNRAEDGINLRYHFGNVDGYSDEFIEEYLDNSPCSVLEMMVALAFRVEEQIMENDEEGNRTGQWFWNMMVSLDLGHMNDAHFDEDRAYFIVSKFLNRDYEPNGKGGLFTLYDCTDDLREVEIWTQFMWYLNENIFY